MVNTGLQHAYFCTLGCQEEEELLPIESRTFVTFQIGNVKNYSYLYKVFKLISRATN